MAKQKIGKLEKLIDGISIKMYWSRFTGGQSH